MTILKLFITSQARAETLESKTSPRRRSVADWNTHRHWQTHSLHKPHTERYLLVYHTHSTMKTKWQIDSNYIIQHGYRNLLCRQKVKELWKLYYHSIAQSWLLVWPFFMLVAFTQVKGSPNQHVRVRIVYNWEHVHYLSCAFSIDASGSVESLLQASPSQE